MYDGKNRLPLYLHLKFDYIGHLKLNEVVKTLQEDAGIKEVSWD